MRMRTSVVDDERVPRETQAHLSMSQPADSPEIDTSGRGRRRPALRSHGLCVVIDDRGIESALRTFKRVILKEGLLKELQRHAYFEKPGDRKRRRIRESIRRKRRQAARTRRYGGNNEQR